MFLNTLLQLEVVEMDKILKSPNLLATCRQLSHGGHSGMNCALDYYQGLIHTRPIDARGVFAKYHKAYVGWALVTKETDDYYFKADPGNVCFQVFVDAKFRRHGIGTKLLRTAKTLVPNEELLVYAWSNRSFFDPMMNEGVCRSI